MKQYSVLVAMGEDRPGLVDGVSRFILDCGCNIEDSRAAILGGEFAMLMLCEGTAEAMEKLNRGAARAGEAAGVSIQVKRTRSPGETARKGTLPYVIEAYSMDHPGIVHRLSAFLAERSINIRALETRLTHAPITGLPLFSVHATVEVPAQASVAEIRRELAGLAGQQNIDIEIRPAK